MSNDFPLRASGSRVLLKRVQDRSPHIIMVGEKYGLTDRVLQVAEVMATGSHIKEIWPIDEPPQPGDLVVYNQARVWDHFRWKHEDILVYPASHLLGVVRDGFLVENPDKRVYERQPV